MKRKIFEINLNQSPEKYAYLYNTNAGKWQKQKCESVYGKVTIPLLSVKKDKANFYIKNQIKHVNDALGSLSKNHNIFVIKQKFKNEIKIGVLGAIGFGEKLIGKIDL